MENREKWTKRIKLWLQAGYCYIFCFRILSFGLKGEISDNIIYAKTLICFVLTIILFSIIQLLFQVAFTTAFTLGVVPVLTKIFGDVIFVYLVIQYHHKLIHALYQYTKQ